MRRHINFVQFAAPRLTEWKRKAAAAQLASATTLLQVRSVGVYEGNGLARRTRYARRLARGAPTSARATRLMG
jgi:hypothetical protein